jgi:molecular chaperone GrpE
MEENTKQNFSEETIVDNGININADDNAAGTTHLNDEMTDDNAVEKLEMELNEQKDKYIRLVAEFDNFRKRTAKEKLELMQTGGKDVIIGMLDVLDDCDRAEKIIEESEDTVAIKQGIHLIFHKLRSSLQGMGVKEMESIGKDFDAEKHEAITEIPAPDKNMKGKIIDQVHKGYYLNDKLIRFAKVVVGS